MNKCGSCTLCCKLLGVQELAKPSGQWCSHCTVGRGCSIYETRPPSCADFECGWLLSNMPVDFRPDHIHMVVTGESDKLNAVIIHVDPNYPEASKSKKAEQIIKSIFRTGKSVLLVTGKQRMMLGNSLADVQLIQEELRKLDESHNKI